MKIRISACIVLALCGLSAGQNSQTQPPSSSQIPAQQTMQSAPVAAVDAARQQRLQRIAAELAALTRSIPADIDTANKGLLPKDMIEKLNRIEKLSKQLRKELAAR